MRRIVLLALLYGSLHATAQTTCPELVPTLMDASGINQSLAVTPEVLRQMSTASLNQQGSMPVDAKRALESAMASGFSVDRMRRNIREKLTASCEPAVYSQALEQLQSPLGQKMLQLELHPVSSPEEAKRMQRYIASFAMQEPRETRMRLVRRLMDTTKAAEILLDQVLRNTEIMMETGLKREVGKEEYAAARAQLLPQVQQFMEAQLYYTYRTASDEELEQYIVLQSTKPMQRLTQDEANAQLYASEQESAELATKIRKVALEQKEKHGAP